MANTVSSQYMGMPVPVPTVDPGPDYATDLNSCLTLLDQHDHSSGKGTQVTPSGINITSDLAFGAHNATLLRSTRYSAQVSPLSSGSDIGALYVSGVDLYYNDINGNQIRLTASGAISGTSGSIGNLVSPASVTYNTGSFTYVFQSAVNTPGNLDAASVIVRELVTNGKGVTLSAPTSLAANYSLTFPAALPASTKILTVSAAGAVGDSYDVDNSTLQVSSSIISVKDAGITNAKMAANSVGTSNIIDANVTTAKILDANVTRSKQAAVGQQATGTITFSTSSGSYVDVTGSSITITSTGRPIILFMTTADDTSAGYISHTAAWEIRITRDSGGGAGGAAAFGGTNDGSTSAPLSTVYFMDPVGAGTRTYALQMRIPSGGGTTGIIAGKFFAYEL